MSQSELVECILHTDACLLYKLKDPGVPTGLAASRLFGQRPHDRTSEARHSNSRTCYTPSWRHSQVIDSAKLFRAGESRPARLPVRQRLMGRSAAKPDGIRAAGAPHPNSAGQTNRPAESSDLANTSYNRPQETGVKVSRMQEREISRHGE